MCTVQSGAGPGPCAGPCPCPGQCVYTIKVSITNFGKETLKSFFSDFFRFRISISTMDF